MPQPAAVNIQQPIHSTTPASTFNTPAADVRSAPMASIQPSMNSNISTSVGSPIASSAAATRAPAQNVNRIREAPKTNRIIGSANKRGLDPAMLQQNNGVLSGLNPASNKDVAGVYDQMMANKGRRAVDPRFYNA